MSRTYKDRGYRRRIVKNSLYQKMLKLWGEDFTYKNKNRSITKRLRIKLEKLGDEDV